MPFPSLPGASGPDASAPPSDPRGKRRIALALSLGLVVLPIQYLLLLVWRAATDVTVVEAVAWFLGMGRSGLPGYYVLFGVGTLLFVSCSFAATYGVGIALLGNRKLALLTVVSSVAVVLTTGVVASTVRSSRLATLGGRVEEMSRRADDYIETLSARTRIEGFRVELGPLYTSMGATTENPQPEWGELYWSIRLVADLHVPTPGVYRFTVVHRLPDEDEPHARLEEEVLLEKGGNPLEVTLDANQTREYQGFWSPERSGGTVVVILRRTVQPLKLYGARLAGAMRSAKRLFGDFAGSLEPTPRTVEVLRERFEL